MFNSCVASAITEKPGSNKILNALMVNTGRKRSQGRIKMEQVKEYLDNLSIGKSAGPDEIHSVLLKELPEERYCNH